ncbi:unnamed protein product [Adineta steineri]|uniref:Disease resistance R13L4/SHOC-2-like LRR domain-containing protein n=1 Tax=Adineta steineri TaxID=433720 RepID=A0A814QLG0_9BILA|nr:unnamed protein product [Adineta steineri]CAF1120626.1 unnamed protein product [Adineta steineri]
MVISKNVIYNPAVFPIEREIVVEENERSTLDCTKFPRDIDIIRSLPFPVQLSPTSTVAKTFALMNNNNDVTELTIYKENLFYEFNLDDQTVRSIPAEIGQLTLLRTLRIYDSPVLHLPNEFGNLKLLGTLIIKNSSLYDLPTAIENLSVLTTLDLSYNNLKTLPSTIASLRSLQTLDIQSNQLTSINELNNMNSLRYLYAQNCSITHLPKIMSQLIYLYMSYNHLQDLIGIGTLGTVSQMKDFDFGYNQIDFIAPEISRIIRYIQKLSVKHNRLTYLAKEIYDQPNAATTFLDISENLFTGDELNSIKATIKIKLPAIKVTY